MLLIKAAILTEWSRIFVPLHTRNAFWWTCHSLIWINVLYYVTGIFITSLACVPYRKIWDVTVTEGRCIDFKAVDLGSSIINLVSDLTILVLPHHKICILQMPISRRIGISCVFMIEVL